MKGYLLVILFLVLQTSLSKPVSIPLSFFATEPYLEVLVGSPIQKVSAILDVSAKETFIFQTSCGDCKKDHKDWDLFNMTVSSTLKETHEEKSINCFGGYASGTEVSDNIAFGKGLGLKAYSFVAVEKETCYSYQQASREYSMTLSMAPGDNNIATKLSQQLGVKPFITAKLNGDSGELVIGDEIPKHVDWNPLVYDILWTIAGRNGAIGTSSFDIDQIDFSFSNNDQISLSPTMMDMVVKEIGAFEDYYGVYHVKCSTASSLPPLRIYSKVGSCLNILPNVYIGGGTDDCVVNFMADSYTKDESIGLNIDAIATNGLILNAKDGTIGFPSA